MKQMNCYETKELIPIVAKLAEKYTSKESTSVTYENARCLMEAVVYCINVCQASHDDNISYVKGTKNQPATQKKISAEDAYSLGYEKVIQKVRNTQDIYNRMIVDFKAYGNENYYDTVTKGLSGFFKYYNPRFAPHETIITMDYPVLCPIVGMTGINAVEKYVNCIRLEQKFMKAFPEEYIILTLSRFQADYTKQFYNICGIILRHILGHMITEKSLDSLAFDKDYEALHKILLSCGREQMMTAIKAMLKRLITEHFDDDADMLCYLENDAQNFVTQLYAVQDSENLRNVVVL